MIFCLPVFHSGCFWCRRHVRCSAATVTATSDTEIVDSNTVVRMLPVIYIVTNVADGLGTGLLLLCILSISMIPSLYIVAMVPLQHSRSPVSSSS